MASPVNHVDTPLEAIVEMAFPASSSKDLSLNDKLVGAYRNTVRQSSSLSIKLI